MRQSDVIVVVFDGLHGLHPLDSEVVDLVRQIGKPTIFVANKCEKPSAALNATELYGLGIEEIIPISAAHRRGIKDLIAKVEEIVGALDIDGSFVRESKGDFDEIEESAPEEVGAEGEASEVDAFEVAELEVAADDQPDRPINISILGKPNVGKSTFVNTLLGEERMITSPLAGTTRDSIKSDLGRNGRRFEIVDTAGLRKKAGVRENTVERFSNIRTLRSLVQSDVAVFLLDASEGIPTEQDARIVGLAHEKGKSLVIVVNKWDLIEKDSRTAEAYRHAVRSVFKFAAYAPVVFVSALTGQRCLNVLDEVVKVYEASRVRLSTAEVNKIFTDAGVPRRSDKAFVRDAGSHQATDVRSVRESPGSLAFQLRALSQEHAAQAAPFRGERCAHSVPTTQSYHQRPQTCGVGVPRVPILDVLHDASLAELLVGLLNFQEELCALLSLEWVDSVCDKRVGV
jgi:ribosome-associated GTPase EngA